MKSRITLLSLTLALFWPVLAVAGDDGDWRRIGNNLFTPDTGADRVGIGVTKPRELLHLFRNDDTTVGLLLGNSYTGNGRRGFLLDYHASNGAELWNFENTDMWFGTNNRRQMTISRSGRVGVGTSNPQDVLHLFRGNQSSVGILMGNAFTGAQRRGFLVDYHASNGAELWNFENTDMWFGTNNSRHMTIARDGRIGIGTLPHTFGFPFDPDLRLDVQGMLRVSDVRVWDGPGQFDLTWARGCHNPGGGTVCGYLENTRIITRESSSRRYKRNIRPLPAAAAARVLDLEAIEYQMKEMHGPRGWTGVGFIAEDVHELGLTELVQYDEEGRPDGVRYKRVAVYLTEVVKAQQQTIARLEAEMNALKRRVDELVER